MSGVRITDRDLGYKALMKRLFSEPSRLAIEVGVFGSAGDAPHKGKNPDGLTVLQIGIFNEFGLGVPERSFIRGYFDENAVALQALAGKLMQTVIDGKRTREQAVNVLGLRMVGEIQARIARGISPPNAESTIRQKGSSMPLIDTGQLRSSISYRVVPG